MKILFVYKFKIIISIIWESFYFFLRIFVKNFLVYIIVLGDDNFDDVKMCFQILFLVYCGFCKVNGRLCFKIYMKGF